MTTINEELLLREELEKAIQQASLDLTITILRLSKQEKGIRVAFQDVLLTLQENNFTHLDLNSCNLNDDEVLSLIEFFNKNFSLQNVTLSNNPFSDDILFMIMESQEERDALRLSLKLPPLCIEANNTGIDSRPTITIPPRSEDRPRIFVRTASEEADDGKNDEDEELGAIFYDLPDGVAITHEDYEVVTRSEVLDAFAAISQAEEEAGSKTPSPTVDDGSKGVEADISDDLSWLKGHCIGINKNRTITHIDFYGLNINDKGAKIIANAFLNNRSLTSINLEYNRIGPAGIAALDDLANWNPRIQHIYLYGNNLADQQEIVINSLKCKGVVDILTQYQPGPTLAEPECKDAGARQEKGVAR